VRVQGEQDLYSLPFFYDNKMGSGEPDMNQFGSNPNHENRKIYEGHPLQGLSEARQAKRFLNWWSPIRSGGNHRTWWIVG
jgi:hypothetical protein